MVGYFRNIRAFKCQILQTGYCRSTKKRKKDRLFETICFRMHSQYWFSRENVSLFFNLSKISRCAWDPRGFEWPAPYLPVRLLLLKLSVDLPHSNTVQMSIIKQTFVSFFPCSSLCLEWIFFGHCLPGEPFLISFETVKWAWLPCTHFWPLSPTPLHQVECYSSPFFCSNTFEFGPYSWPLGH